MCLRINLSLFLVISLVALNSANDLKYGEFKTKEDKPYRIVNFKIPQVLWEKALQPAPLLKSPLTVVVPVYVADDDDDENEIDVRDGAPEVNVVVDNTMTDNPMDSSPVSPVVPIVVETSPVEETPITVQASPPVSVNTSLLSTETPVLLPPFPPVANLPVAPSPPVSPVQTPVAAPPVVQTPIDDFPPQEVQGQVIRFPCTCVGGQCGCCTGSILDRFSMKACGNITFVPEDFVFDVRLSVNNNTIVRRRVSASDPPPICFNPRRAPFVRVCAEISNIRIRNRNAFACLEINADIGGFTVYSASFRCFSLGSSGLQTGLKPKPVSSGPKPVNLFQNSANSNNNQGGTILDAAQNIIQGQGELFGQGPLENIGNALDNIFGRENN